MQSETTHKVLVRAIPESGFSQIFRGGLGWPAGETLKEVSPETLKALQSDGKHFLVRELSNEEFEQNRERLGISLSKEEILKRENDELRGRVAKGEVAFDMVAKMETRIARLEEELSGMRGSFEGAMKHFESLAEKMEAASARIIASTPATPGDEAKPEPTSKPTKPKADEAKPEAKKSS
jgi:regulator of replication initiation timing